MNFAVAAGMVAAVTLAVPTAFAQTAPGSAGTPNSTIPEKVKPTGEADTGRSTTLSDKLDATNGVIKPNTAVDPGMAKAPPSTDAVTPVIKPQGTPGGPPGPEAK